MTKNSSKFRNALLFNALVMPGSGHMYVGQKVRGFIIAVVTLILVILPVVIYSVTTIKMLDAVSLAGNGAINAVNALGHAFEMNKRAIIACLVSLGLIWLYSILDIVLVMKKKKVNSEQ